MKTILNGKEIVGAFEFRSFGDDPGVDVQIEEWLQKYPQVTILDIKYQVVPYVESDALNFATFALVLFHEAEVPEVNRATTQRMQAPASMPRRQR
jgi:hypothetical protein